MTTREHIVDGQFKSDKYDWSPPGFVPLKLTDPMAQDLLLEYAKRRRAVDEGFADDLEFALGESGVTRANGKLTLLFDAVAEWAGACEGVPDDPNDADLLKALWTFEGDRTEPCEGCDGDCGEPCAPCSVVAAHRMLDAFSADWRKRRGVNVVNAGEEPAPTK